MPTLKICETSSELVSAGHQRGRSAWWHSHVDLGPVMTLLFGVPHTHEDDPERALRAAVRVVTSVGRTPGKGGRSVLRGGGEGLAGVTLSVHVGVETGMAVVGPAGGAAQPGYMAVGAAIGTAAALQAVARPNSVLVGPVTRAATEGILEWGPSNAYPRTTTRCLRLPISLAARRVRRPRSGGVAWLQGLRSSAGGLRWRCSRKRCGPPSQGGGGSSIVITGEAGLGKSRLVGECRNYFMGWVGAASGRLPLWLEGRCASYASSTPYGAYQQLLSRFIGAPLEGGEAVLRPSLEAAMRAVFGKNDEDISLLARMLGLPGRPNDAYLDRLDPKELQEQTFSAVRAMLASLISRGPTVLALEDLHWSDPTSLRLTASLASLAATGPLFVLGTRRPEPDPGLGDLEAELSSVAGRPLRVLKLVPMDELEERNLAHWLLGGEVDEGVLEIVCQGVGGNPLFLEERLASLIDTGAVQHGSAGWRTGPGTTDAVPEAIERLIRSRADRLSPAAREAIVAASIFGDTIERAAIGAVSDLTDELDEALAELVSGGFLTGDGHEPEPVYRFRHALIRDAVYRSLLRPERRRLHARAAWHMEASAGDGLDDDAVLVGQHWAAAGENDRAIHYFEMAADRAARAYANEESIALYRKAISLTTCAAIAGVGPWPLTPTNSPTVARLHRKLCSILLMVDSFDEARKAANEGIARLRAVDDMGTAWLHLWLGEIEYQDRHFDAALSSYAAAKALIGPIGLDDDQERINLWLAVQFRETTHSVGSKRP